MISMCQMGHGQTSRSELGGEYGELRDVGDGSEWILVGSLGGKSNGVVVVQADLRALASLNCAIKLHIAHGKASRSFVSLLQGIDQLSNVHGTECSILTFKPVNARHASDGAVNLVCNHDLDNTTAHDFD